jgi:hypothetical protein
MVAAVIAKAPQPAINETPPNGAIAPSDFIPENVMAYKLPEKITTPIINNHPLNNRVIGGVSKRLMRIATKNNARA